MISSFLLAVSLDLTDPYVEIIAASIIIILSFIYNQISEKTNIPSVLMLILTGIGINLGLSEWGVEDMKLMPILELLGIVGLIMIVLEAALDLELTREKLPLIGKSLLVALLCLLGSSFGIAFIIQQFYPASYTLCLLYAIPLSIMSSAIIIPSVAGLIDSKKEFLIYESAFSDILGIMFFYFVISLLESGGGEAASSFGISLFLTIIVGVVASYALIYLFKDIKGQIRLFLLIAVLLILYAAGKLLHLSPLLIIMIFGIMLANHQMFFRIFKNFFEDHDPIAEIQEEFHLVTLETAFVVRTFFFVVFGMTINLASLLDANMLAISLAVIGALYIVRVVLLRLFLKKDIIPELWIAPRGLITILLFFAIPQAHEILAFDSGILLYVIIITSLVMTIALILNGKKSAVQSDT